MPSEALYHVALVRTDVSENVSSPSSVFFGITGFHSCVAMESLLLNLTIEGCYLWSKNAVLWSVFTAVSITDAFYYTDWTYTKVPVETLS
jgi:hypothetical protein